MKAMPRGVVLVAVALAGLVLGLIPVGAASAEAAVAASENGSASAVTAAEEDAAASADDASASDLASTFGGATSVGSTGSGVTSSLIVSSCERARPTSSSQESAFTGSASSASTLPVCASPWSSLIPPRTSRPQHSTVSKKGSAAFSCLQEGGRPPGVNAVQHARTTTDQLHVRAAT